MRLCCSVALFVHLETARRGVINVLSLFIVSCNICYTKSACRDWLMLVGDGGNRPGGVEAGVSLQNCRIKKKDVILTTTPILVLQKNLCYTHIEVLL